MKHPTFSICIPNFNYARYLRLTLESVLSQSFSDFEIVVADNASTDDSVQVAESIGDPRVRLVRNAQNVGFAANIDRATETARGRYMIVLSSDDLMLPDALATYARVLDRSADPERSVLTSAIDVVDGEGKRTGIQHRPKGELFYRLIDSAEASVVDTRDPNDVDAFDGLEALRQSLVNKDTPAMFLATCYPRSVWDAVCGYRSGYRIWPDSHFLNKVLALEGLKLVYVPRRLFAYRVHANNQMSNELGRGALKYHVDAYLNTLEFPEPVLSRVGLSRADLVRIFVEKAVMERGLQALASGSPLRAARLLFFGLATYPEATLKERKTYALAALLGLGPLAPPVSRKLHSLYRSARGR